MVQAVTYAAPRLTKFSKLSTKSRQPKTLCTFKAVSYS